MGKEEKKLQITLAKLQTDVQIYLTICFGFLAILASGIIGFEQLYFTTNVNGVVKSDFLGSIIIFVIGMIFITYVSVKQMQAKRDEMEKLS